MNKIVQIYNIFFGFVLIEFLLPKLCLLLSLLCSIVSLLPQGFAFIFLDLKHESLNNFCISVSMFLVHSF